MTHKCDCRVTINELLCFLDSKLDVMDDVALIQICESNFTEKEIESAKVILSEFTSRRSLRKGDGKTKRDLKDLINTLRETEKGQLPTFVAKNLNRLPPVSFDYIDVTTLLKDLVIIKQELANVKLTYTRASTTEEIQNEVSNLRKQLEQKVESENSTFTSEGSAHSDASVITLRPSTPRPASLSTYSQVVASGCGASVPATKACDRPPSTSPVTGAHEESSFPPRRNSNRRRSQATKKSQDLKSLVYKNTNTNNNKRKSPKNNQGKSEIVTSKIKVAPKHAYLYVTRFDKCTTTQDVIDYIAEAGESVVSVELLIPYKATPFASFKITVLQTKYSKFCSENFWPVGIEFRGYRSKSYFKGNTPA